jgi:hypothetical protein
MLEKSAISSRCPGAAVIIARPMSLMAAIGDSSPAPPASTAAIFASISVPSRRKF